MYDLLGVKVMSHTGGIDGMLSQVTWVPERRLGFVILTNTEGHNNVYAAVGRRILDLYLGAPPRDWSAIMLAQTNKQEATQAAARAAIGGDASQGQQADRCRSIVMQVSTHNEMYGDVNDQASRRTSSVLQFGPSLTGDLEPWSEGLVQDRLARPSRRRPGWWSSSSARSAR